MTWKEKSGQTQMYARHHSCSRLVRKVHT